MRVPVKKPKPDFGEFIDVLLGKKKPTRPLLMEYVVDDEIRKYIGGNLLDQNWTPLIFQNKDATHKYFLNFIDFWHRLGYDFVRYEEGAGFYSSQRLGADTAELSRNKRYWVEEGKGMISNWEEFEKYKWPPTKNFDLSRYEFIANNLPDGMGFIVSHCAGIFENAVEHLLGFEGVSYLLYDNPELVFAVFKKTGEIIYAFYEQLLQIEGIGCVFQGDDLGFRTSTFLPADIIREHILNWHKKIAELSHQKSLPYFLHSCGNIYELMDDLIDDVKIDGKHSTEDVIMNIIDFKRKYPQIAALGGVDIDFLAKADEEAIRKYVKKIMDACMSEGKFAIGSGNSIPNYIPVKNYLIMLDEALSWQD